MGKTTLKKLLLTAFFAALTALGGFLRIPVGNSAISLQFFFTCMAGLLLGPGWAAASQGLYVLLGLLGLPVFTQGGGLMYLAHPTFGFLLGLIPAAFFIGLLGEKHRFLAYLSGLLILYCCGIPYFHFVLGGSLPFGQSVLYGGVLFLPFDGIKIFCAELLERKLRRHGLSAL